MIPYSFLIEAAPDFIARETVEQGLFSEASNALLTK